jgi:LPS O-antigen subunit length determinant protein (WzzB/FepE family)
MAKTTLIDESPFNSYKELFKTETGLDADKNIEAYIQYYNAIINNKSLQTLLVIANKLSLEIQTLPDDISRKVFSTLQKEGIIK